MKFAIKSIVAATAFVAAGLANAGTVDLTTSNSVVDGSATFSGLVGSGTLSFSKSLIGAINAGGITVAEVAPATAAFTMNGSKYVTIAATAPVTSLSGSYDGTTLSVSSVGTQGGALQSAVDDPDGFASTGGSLEIKNLRVDLGAKKVYATLVGAHGVGTIDNLYLWDIAAVTGPTSFAVVNGTTQSVNALTGLSINKPAFDLFSQSLGLTDAGIAALSKVKDYGRIDSTISVTSAITPAVPEASSMAYALMGLGVVGFIAARRRAAK